MSDVSDTSLSLPQKAVETQGADALQLVDVTLPGSQIPFNLTLPVGQVSVVFGGNRAGKTDLLRLIAGLPTRATGSVVLKGRGLHHLAVRERPVALVNQAFINYPNLTVAQNIALPMRSALVADSGQRVRGIAQQLQIDSLLERYPHELSGGQQQRLAIARALAKQAEILLLDEPLVNLDFKLRESLERELRTLLSERDLTVVYASSDRRDAFAMGDWFALLDGGALVQAGVPMDIYRNPASLRAMEMLCEPQLNCWQDAGSICAVRPEHVQLGASSGGFEFEMLLEGQETNGTTTFLFGRVNGEPWVVHADGLVSLAMQTSLPVHVSPEHVRRFDGRG